MALRIFSRNTLQLARVSSIRSGAARWVSLNPDEKLAGDEEQATGAERTEQEARRETGGDFYQRGPPTGPFGTAEKPFEVLSHNDSRIIGCTGGVAGTDAHHGVVWFEVKEGKALSCPECSQVFTLARVSLEDAHGHH